MNTPSIHQQVDNDTTTSVKNETVGDLYRSHNLWLLSWLRRKLGCSDDAADLMHDTFSRVLQKDDLSDIREPRAFLTTIAHGIMVNHLRRRDIEQAYLMALSQLPEAESPSTETLCMMVEALTKIDEMLDGLPDHIRSAFLWFQLEGISHAEIASRLSVSVSSVRQYIAKALLHCIEFA